MGRTQIGDLERVSKHLKVLEKLQVGCVGRTSVVGVTQNYKIVATETKKSVEKHRSHFTGVSTRQIILKWVIEVTKVTLNLG